MNSKRIGSTRHKRSYRSPSWCFITVHDMRRHKRTIYMKEVICVQLFAIMRTWVFHKKRWNCICHFMRCPWEKEYFHSVTSAEICLINRNYRITASSLLAPLFHRQGMVLNLESFCALKHSLWLKKSSLNHLDTRWSLKSSNIRIQTLTVLKYSFQNNKLSKC